ncbi:Acyl-CoA Delta(11) desaturase [Orchesella cincta]|uniref:Acyl-CoA Delta(11) desaturase n=1 Tax=Orchesella cincta TaxID=48709 RepID=A0A1D2MQD8_ORCCI|nr:Acyl-CoA Delta(11) desaturase [Orchesella cincta]
MCGTKRKSRSPPASVSGKLGTNDTKEEAPKLEIVWRNVIIMAYIHIAGTYGLYLWFSGQMLATTIVIGAHRLWAHKCYKAKLPLRIILAICQTFACQNSIYEWCRDHRVHHKFTETHADPHNAARGFFFAHVGWLLVKKHEDVKTKGQTVDMSDLEKDSVVMFQKKYYLPLTIFCSFVVPYICPLYFGEEPYKAWYMVVCRYMLILNFTWLVNSAAHLWGPRPYDNNIHATENALVSGLAVGEGWHNYHHVFPWDYKAAELTTYNYNWTTALIDFFAWVGWAYDLKTVPERIVYQRVHRTGDGSHPKHNHGVGVVQDDDNGTLCNNNLEVKNSWGWNDKDVTKEERDITIILKQNNKKSQ